MQSYRKFCGPDHIVSHVKSLILALKYVGGYLFRDPIEFACVHIHRASVSETMMNEFSKFRTRTYVFVYPFVATLNEKFESSLYVALTYMLIYV